MKKFVKGLIFDILQMEEYDYKFHDNLPIEHHGIDC